MSDERREVLRRVADGSLAPEDAADLLSALDERAGRESMPSSSRHQRAQAADGVEGLLHGLAKIGPALAKVGEQIGIAVGGRSVSRGSIWMTDAKTVSKRTVTTHPIQGAPRLVVDSDAGPLEIIASTATTSPTANCAEGEVSVEAEIHGPSAEAIASTTFTVDHHDPAVVRVTFKAGDWPVVNRYAHLRINVPSGCHVEAVTAAGHIEMYGMQAGASLRTSGGHINVRDSVGELHLRTSGGHLDVHHANGRVDGETSGGHINATGNLASGSRLQTSGGHISLRGSADCLQAVAAAGNVEVNGPLTGTSTLRTSAGNVDARQVDGSIEAHTSMGNVRVAGRLEGENGVSTSMGSVVVDGLDGALRATTSMGSIVVSGRPVGSSEIHARGGSVDLRITKDAHVTVESQGDHQSSDFAWTIDRRRMSGSVGDGSQGSVSIRAHRVKVGKA